MFKNFGRTLIMILVLACALSSAQAWTILDPNVTPVPTEAPTEAPERFPATEEGTDYLVLIDRSGTMKMSDPKLLVMEAVMNLPEKLRAEDGLAVIGFGYDVVFETEGFLPQGEDHTHTGRPEYMGCLEVMLSEAGWGNPNLVDPNEDTNTGNALAVARKYIEERSALYPKREFRVLLITDGKVSIGDSNGFFAAHPELDRQDKRSAKALQAMFEEIEASRQLGMETAQWFKQEGVILHSVGIYQIIAEELGMDITQWCAETGGTSLAMAKGELEADLAAALEMLISLA